MHSHAVVIVEHRGNSTVSHVFSVVLLDSMGNLLMRSMAITRKCLKILSFFLFPELFRFFVTTKHFNELPDQLIL